MHFLFRVVAVVVMVVALARWGLVLADTRKYFAGESTGRPVDVAFGQPAEWTGRVEYFLLAQGGPATLFCFGAILYALTRISWVQEQGKDID
jgi:hypothetical protein